jgi:hypothetical protein
MTICIHCKRLDEEHISLKCLFSPTLFAPICCADCKEAFHVYPPNPPDPMTTAEIDLRLAMYLDGNGEVPAQVLRQQKIPCGKN